MSAKPTPKIDAALMEKAIKLRREGKSMEAIGAALGVKATAYLAKKIKATYGPDALAKPAAQAVPQPEPAKPAAKRRRVVKKAAKA